MSFEKMKEEVNDDKGIFPSVLNFMKMASWPFLEMIIIDSLLMENYVDRIPRYGTKLWYLYPVVSKMSLFSSSSNTLFLYVLTALMLLSPLTLVVAVPLVLRYCSL